MATVSFYGVLGAKCPAGDGYGQFVVYYVQKEETAKKKKKKLFYQIGSTVSSG